MIYMKIDIGSKKCTGVHFFATTSILIILFRRFKPEWGILDFGIDSDEIMIHIDFDLTNSES